jgi:hypothetical protein
MKSASSTDCREKNTALSPLFPLDVLRIFVNNEKNDGAIRYIVVGLFIFYNGTSS